jgi:phosphonate transport system substrate-binding protein
MPTEAFLFLESLFMSSQPTSTPAPAPQNTVAWGKILVITVVLVAIAGGIYFYFVNDSKKYEAVDNSAMLKSFIAKFKDDLVMKKDFSDADSDGIADAPKDAAKFISPKELNFIVIAGDDHERNAKEWEPILASLSKKIGKPVKYVVSYDAPIEGPGTKPEDKLKSSIDTFDTQARWFDKGDLHLCAFSTGQVSLAVNTMGFVPLFSPADDKGDFGYEMEIIVPADSPVKDLKEFKGKELTLTSLSSNAGGRVPLVVLKEEFGLMQGRDFSFRITGDYTRSILSVCYGVDAADSYRTAKTAEDRQAALKSDKPGRKIDGAAVANDLLQRMITQGVVKPEQFRSVYKSKRFPPLCFGVRYDLDPKIRAAIEETFKEINIKGSPIEERYPGKSKFVKVDYKKDWAYVREMDEKLTKLLDSK